MDPGRARERIVELARAGVGGISFSAGEPFLYIKEIAALVKLCSDIGIYTRIVTNSYWARTETVADDRVALLKNKGLNQLRLSFSRWHQEHIDRGCVLKAARSCRKLGMPYFVSFVTDFSEEDDPFETFLWDNDLRFFPEPVIYAGRAESFRRRPIRTDYQANRCDMNPYLAPDGDLYACCDAGSQFSDTGFFYLGNLGRESAETLFAKTEKDRLHNLVRTMGISAIASFAGMRARDIITYSKCELCRKLFNDPEVLSRLRRDVPRLETWHR